MPSALSAPLSLSPSYPALTGEAGAEPFSRGDEGLELSSKTSVSIQNGPGSGAESGAVGPVPMFWLNLGLGAEWAALSAATQAAVSELPLAALRELADLTSDVPNQFAAATAKIDGLSQ